MTRIFGTKEDKQFWSDKPNQIGNPKFKIKNTEVVSLTTNIVKPSKAEEIIETLNHCIDNLDKAEVLFSTKE